MDIRSTERSPHIDSLPTEVFLHVFSYLTPTYLCETVSKVCTYWEGLCNDPCLNKTLEFRGGEVCTDTAVKLLKVAPLLESLTVGDMNETCLGKISEVVWQHNHKIRALVIANKWVRFSIEQVYMNKFFKKCNMLHTLILRECCVLEKTFYKNLCIQLPHLKVLHLEYEESCISLAVENLVKSSIDLEDLQMIAYDKVICRIHSKDIIALCKRFFKTLRSFRLECGVWTTEAFCELQKCNRLENLGIIRFFICSNEGLLSVASIPSLRRLELSLFNYHLDDSTLLPMFSSGGLTNLVSLELRTHLITNQITAAIGDHLKNLQTLTLNGTHITQIISLRRPFDSYRSIYLV